MTDPEHPHDLNAIWDSVHEVQNRQTSAQTEFAALRTMVENLSRDMQRVMAILSRPAEKTNWIGLAGFTLAAFLGFHEYLEARLRPVEGETREVKERQIVFEQRDYEQSFKIGYQTAKLEAVSTRVREIDEQGSRRWNRGSSQPSP